MCYLLLKYYNDVFVVLFCLFVCLFVFFWFFGFYFFTSDTLKGWHHLLSSLTHTFVEYDQIIKLFVLITKRVEFFWLSFSFLYLFFFIFLFSFIYLFLLRNTHFDFWFCTLNPSSPNGGLQQPPKQFWSWCSKSRSQGVKLLRVPSNSSFSFILAKTFRTYHLPRG